MSWWKLLALVVLLWGSILVFSKAASARVRYAASTSYCLHGRMADGTYTRWGSVAMNGVRLGTRIKLVNTAFFGRRRFTVRDRIGWGSQLDLWHSSCQASRQWGRRTVRYRFGW